MTATMVLPTANGATILITPTLALPMATTAQTGLRVASSSAPVPGMDGAADGVATAMASAVAMDTADAVATDTAVGVAMAMVAGAVTDTAAVGCTAVMGLQVPGVHIRVAELVDLPGALAVMRRHAADSPEAAVHMAAAEASTVAAGAASTAVVAAASTVVVAATAAAVGAGNPTSN